MTAQTAPGGESRLALSAGIGCYLIWGFVPLVFQAIGRLGAAPWESLAHRILWSLPTAGLIVLAAGQGRQVLAVLRRPRVLGWLCVSSLMIASNWSMYIGA